MELTVTIPEIEYKMLLRDRAWLQALEAAGVDNWDGMDIASEMMNDTD